MSTTEATVPPADCPDWCQSKPHDEPDGGFDGPHTWPAIPSLDGDVDQDGDYDNCALVSADLVDGAEHQTVINLIAPNLTLTPKQARSVALGLLTVADWAEDQTSA